MMRQIIKEKQAYSIPEAAQIAGVGRSTVNKWIDQGVLPCQQYPGSGKRPIRRILRDDWDLFMQQHRKPEETEKPAGTKSFKYGCVTLNK
jgi:excisionase family DNA binding protein